jgi:DNA-binding SARP family transcriptional activator
LEFRVLGPLQVRVGDAYIHLSGQRQRQVLALLLLHANQVVTLASFVDAVWDEEPPASAKRQIQNCVSRLRREFDHGGARRSVLVGDGPRYRIRVEDGELDAQLFDARLAAARAAPTEAAKAEELRSALRLWRGPAFADVGGMAVEAAAARLNEHRLAVTEWCVDIELRLGRHHELIGELTELTATHPLRERLIGQLMIALYRAGRRSDALHVYRLTSERLADELGLDPSVELRRLRTAILRDEGPASAGRGRTDSDPNPAAGGPAVVPRQLPAVTGQFVGRTDALGALDRHAESAGSGVVISALVGPAGVGKTRAGRP